MHALILTEHNYNKPNFYSENKETDFKLIIKWLIEINKNSMQCLEKWKTFFSQEH